jgi:hypothetical protein
MAELTIVIRLGDKELRVEKTMLNELTQVCKWTAYKNKTEWLQGLNDEAPVALQAAYALAVWRETGTKPAISEIDFDTDTVDSWMVDETNQRVELVFEANENGTLRLDGDNKAILSRDAEGRPQLRYTATKELLPPTQAAPSIT